MRGPLFRSTWRAVVAALALVAAPAVAAGTAGGTPATFAANGCFTDATGDVLVDAAGTTGEVPRADVVEWCASSTPQVLLLQMEVAEPTDPLTDPTWDRYGSAVVFFYTDAEGTPRTVQLAKGTTDDSFEWYVIADGERVCEGDATFADGIYTAAASQACIGSPGEIDLQAAMFYGRDADGGFQGSPRDYAPDVGQVVLPQGSVGTGQGIDRLAGPERIATAIEVSQASFEPGTATGVVVASAEDFPDALVAAPLAAALDAPVLLTPSDALPQQVVDEIVRAAGFDKPITIMGGTAAISEAVQAQLAEVGQPITRVAGDSRFSTSVAAAEAANADPSTILLAFGGSFGDALVAGAAAPLFDGTVVLVDDGGMSPAVQAYLDANPQADVFPVGRRAIEATPPLDGAVVGDTPEEVSVAMARIFPDPTAVTIASSQSFPDGLAGGAFAARAGVPLLLTPRDAMHAEVLSFLREAGPWRSITLFGGDAALGPTVAAQAAATLGDPAPEPDPSGEPSEEPDPTDEPTVEPTASEGA